MRLADRAVRPAIIDCRAVYEQAVKSAVVRLRRRALGQGELVECVLDGLRGQRRIEPNKRLVQALLQHHLPVVLPFGGEFAPEQSWGHASRHSRGSSARRGRRPRHRTLSASSLGFTRRPRAIEILDILIAINVSLGPKRWREKVHKTVFHHSFGISNV